ncbi:filamentous hemagglutinin N-terminal domain-containing protein [Photorhabdus cinerea]|uniref:filamentous hemagglutinin N-terminal domain-containing protein n=1 Tax=Photorhabdus cinerea TaxID=471575 RepID=UPI00140D2A49|nr:filamentous hemagglutinin N-terminal domain-containing protein [Photorhabdus cinerea]
MIIYSICGDFSVVSPFSAVQHGTPQVNIQTPSATGVSHNAYRQFDVDKHGVILNNSQKETDNSAASMPVGQEAVTLYSSCTYAPGDAFTCRRAAT